VNPRYPVYIPSKGRSDSKTALTVKALRADRVPFFIVVEPSEADAYRAFVGSDGEVLVLPFENLGRGSIPARNWIREHAEANGYAKHWQLDDNIFDFRRLWKGRRIPCHAGVALRVCEDLSDRHENIGVSGLNYQMFVLDDTAAPYFRNCHVYSCTLINHAMPYRWRGRMNEDTDLCLQALVNGWTTLLINAFMAHKMRTMALTGGNSNELYGMEKAEGTDTRGRYEMARQLEELWPGLVKTGRRFGRYQHTVNWRAFDTPFSPSGNGSTADVDEYGLRLRALREPESPYVREVWENFDQDIREVAAFDEVWRGLPGFEARVPPPQLRIEFTDSVERDSCVRLLGVRVSKKNRESFSAWWPPRGRQDLASLRFEYEEESRD